MSYAQYVDRSEHETPAADRRAEDCEEGRLLPVDLDRTPLERECFLHQLRQEWIADDPQRLRDVAALVLFVNGFTVREIGPLLALNAGHVARLIQHTRETLAVHFAPPV